jgi:hypothetical protein
MLCALYALRHKANVRKDREGRFPFHGPSSMAFRIRTEMLDGFYHAIIHDHEPDSGMSISGQIE